MDPPVRNSAEAAASVLALMVAANGQIDPRELQSLDALRAFERLGVSRERFLELAQHCLAEMGCSLSECSWLRTATVTYLDALLDCIDDPPRRLLVCELAAAVIGSDGCISMDERLVYAHVLARWRITAPRTLQQAPDDAAP